MGRQWIGVRCASMTGASGGQAWDGMMAVRNMVAPAAVGRALRADPREAGKSFFLGHEGTETAGTEIVAAL